MIPAFPGRLSQVRQVMTEPRSVQVQMNCNAALFRKEKGGPVKGVVLWENTEKPPFAHPLAHAFRAHPQKAPCPPSPDNASFDITLRFKGQTSHY